MENKTIDIRVLRRAVVAILDHILDDLNLERIPIDPAEDVYWLGSPSDEQEPRLSSSSMSARECGRLSDDVDFVSLIDRGDTNDASYTLVHVAPLLRYVGEKIRQ